MGRWAAHVGNLGAHASTAKITKDDARYPLDFLLALMQIIYELRPKFASWQAAPNQSPRMVKKPVVRATKAAAKA